MFRVKASSDNIIDCFNTEPKTGDAKGSTVLYNRVAIIRDGTHNDMQSDNNDTFTIRRHSTGNLCKVLIHSAGGTNGDCELAFKSGSITANNDSQTTLKHIDSTKNFQISQGSRFRRFSNKNIIIKLS